MASIGIIGHNGYIGSYIYDNLLLNGYNVKSLDFRYTTIDDIELNAFDIILYTGGVTGRDICNVLNRDVINSRNIDDIVKLSSKLNEVQLLIYLSTAAVYEGCENTPANEKYDILTDKLDIYTRSMYDRGKWCK